MGTTGEAATLSMIEKQEILDLNEFSEKEINLEKIPLLVSTLKSKLYEVFDEVILELKKIKKK